MQRWWKGALVAFDDAKVAMSSYEARGRPSLRTVVNRAYYAALCAARALLVSRGLRAGSHTATVRLIGRDFVKTGKIDARAGRDLRELLEMRMISDYDLAVEPTQEEALEAIDKAQRFLAEVEKILKQDKWIEAR